MLEHVPVVSVHALIPLPALTDPDPVTVPASKNVAVLARWSVNVTLPNKFGREQEVVQELLASAVALSELTAVIVSRAAAVKARGTVAPLA